MRDMCLRFRKVREMIPMIRNKCLFPLCFAWGGGSLLEKWPPCLWKVEFLGIDFTGLDIWKVEVYVFILMNNGKEDIRQFR